ncbi:ArsR/SmtB family transcription factor [Bacillus sp. 2205SS5-2]|uniref:ArsR/SmtB family transcription factor n=1 Tax=Bacillus sp. 2205SS5-2 TaxID=3109031 RepID=UPI003005673E
MVNYNNENLDQVFSVLSDPIRRSIIQELAKGEKTVKALAEPFDISLPGISKHLRVLEKAELVSYRKMGRYKYYCLKPESIDDASEWLSFLRTFWESQLTSLEKHLLQSEEEKGGIKNDHDE